MTDAYFCMTKEVKVSSNLHETIKLPSVVFDNIFVQTLSVHMVAFLWNLICSLATLKIRAFLNNRLCFKQGRIMPGVLAQNFLKC